MCTSSLLQIEKIVVALAQSNPAQQEILFQRFRVSPEMRMNLLMRASDLKQQRRQKSMGEGRSEGRGGEGVSGISPTCTYSTDLVQLNTLA